MRTSLRLGIFLCVLAGLTQNLARGAEDAPPPKKIPGVFTGADLGRGRLPRPESRIQDDGVAEINGAKYHRFTWSGAQLLVPFLHTLGEKDFEHASCGSALAGRASGGQGLSAPPSGHGSQDSVALKAEIGASESSTAKVFAEQIQKTVREKCSGERGTDPIPVDLSPGFGVSIKPKDGDRANIKEYRLYNKGLAPNLNLDLKF